jgi:hypothetical protein
MREPDLPTSALSARPIVARQSGPRVIVAPVVLIRVVVARRAIAHRFAHLQFVYRKILVRKAAAGRRNGELHIFPSHFCGSAAG